MSLVTETNSPVSNKSTRLLSLDALRGFDMLWILGAEGIFAALFALTGFSLFNVLAAQMLHSPWHGLTAYDIIFPLFIFLSGISLGLADRPFSSLCAVKQKQKLAHAIRRLFILIALGIVYNHGWNRGIPVSLDDIRYVSVLGRIGFAGFIATLLVWYCSEKMQWSIAAAILISYWLLLTFVEIDGYGGGNFSKTGVLNIWFDQHWLPGVTHRNLLLDPEGLLSNFPSIVNALAGVFVGKYIISCKQNSTKLLSHLLLIGSILLVVGYCWGVYFPINKTLWTSSFTLVTCGYSILLFSLFYFIIDVLKIQRWATFFVVIGVNSIVIYVAMAIVNWQYTAHNLFGGFIRTLPDLWQIVFDIISFVLVQWLILYWLYRLKIFIKV